MNYFMLQATGREGAGAVRWLPASIRLAFIATVLSGLALAAYMVRSNNVQVPVLPLIVAGLAILAGQIFVEFGASRLQLEGRYTALSAWQGITQGGRFAVLLCSIWAGASIGLVLGGYGMVGVASVAAAALLLRNLKTVILSQATPGATAFGRQAPSMKETARGSIPFALMTMFYVFYFQWPIVILEWLRGGAAAGAYNGAFLIISAMSLIPNVIYMKYLLPKVCRWAEHDRAVYTATLHVGVPAMLLCGSCLMAVIFVMAPLILTALFGPAYAAGVPALRILALTVPVRFVQSAYSSLFIKTEDMTRKVRYLGLSAIVGGAASLLLVPRFGLQGAAGATLLAELSLLALHLVGTSRFMDGINVTDTFRPQIFRASLRHLLQEFQTER